MAAKFKVGDRVAYMKHKDLPKEMDIPYGSSGTVLDDSNAPCVKMDVDSYNVHPFFNPESGRQSLKCRILAQEELVLLSEYSDPKPEERLKMPLTARFIGTDSLGYKHNVKYALLFSVDDKGGVTVERFHKGCDIDGLCHYDSFRSFIQNWETSF